MKFTSFKPEDRLTMVLFNNNGFYVKNAPQLQKIGVIPSNSKDAYKYLSNLLSNLKKVSFVINDCGYWALTDAGETYARQLISMLDNDVPEIEDTIQKTCNDIIGNSEHITEDSLKLAAQMIDKVIASKSGTFELNECYEKIEKLEKQLEEKNEKIKLLNGIIASLKRTNLNKLNMLNAANMKIMQLENSFDKISSSLSSMLPWISSLKDGSGM